MSRAAPGHCKRLGREFAMQFLYQRELSAEWSAPDALTHFWEQLRDSAEIPENRDFRRAQRYAEKLIAGVDAVREELDQRIVRHAAPAWPLNRMAAVDRNLLRVAIYEMLHCPEVPPVVSINEAVEIAKEFGGDESSAFINGILNSVMAEVGRPARVPLRPAAESGQ